MTKPDDRKAKLNDLDLTNAAAVAEAKMILAEMAKVKAELDEMLGLPV